MAASDETAQRRQASPSRASASETVHALTFDVEDWFHLGIPNYPREAEWRTLPSMVEPCTDNFLRMCSATKARATFFVLGWVADRYPRIVPRILNEGHEVGTHSFWHRRIANQTRAEFTRDLQDSVSVLESQGASIVGYRAPCFAVPSEASWMFDTIRQLGLTYSSSQLAYCRLQRGRSPNAPWIRSISNGRQIAELPISRVAFGVARARCYARYSGSGYLRILPRGLVEACMEWEARNGRATVAYLHPRDLTRDVPRIPMSPAQRIRKYTCLDAKDKVNALLRRYQFASAREILEASLGCSLEAAATPRLSEASREH